MATKPIRRGVITSGFGERILQGNREFHPGIDISVVGVPDNIPVYAAKNGKVKYFNNDISAGVNAGGGFGRVVYLRLADGWFAIYPHLSLINGDLHINDQVKEGDFIGIMGNTGHSLGRHLHYEERPQLSPGGARMPQDIYDLYV